MKAILMMFDSLNRQMLSSYGCDWTVTPNFKRLAEKTVAFDCSYAGSLPCMPARRELHTGRYNFLHRSWGPLEPYDDSMPEILSQKDNDFTVLGGNARRNERTEIYTHLISDHQHYWEDGGCTYHHRYNSWEIVRGQEGDRWKGHVQDPAIPEHLGMFWRQDAVNRIYMKKEEEQPQPNVFKLGLEFLEKNKDTDNWFLHLETFDPHEPFYTIQKYKEFYPHDYKGPHFDWPFYGKVTEGKEVVEHGRYQYAALLSMCDHYLGKLLDFMDRNGMWKDTLLMVNTDHGYLLGEHGCWAKMVHPLYDEVVHTPFFVWDPRREIKGERRQSLVQTIDIAPTILEFFERQIPQDMQGKALGPVLDTDMSVHEGVLFGRYGAQINVTDGRYVYMREPAPGNSPLYEYTHMPTHMRTRFSVEEMRSMKISPPFSFTKGAPLMRIESALNPQAWSPISFGETKLYDLYNDPSQDHPLEDKTIEKQMLELMIKLMKENDAPWEQFERLGLGH
jgi:arylsulfatase A-like enzyme